jgi:NTE family protein
MTLTFDEPLAAPVAVVQPQAARDRVAHVELLRELDADAVDEVLAESVWLEAPAGSVVFRQGDPGHGVYFVVEGRLRLTRTEQASGDEVYVGDVERSRPVGELGVLLDAPRTATLHAVRDSVLLFVPPEVFERITRQHSSILLPLSRRLAASLAESGRPRIPPSVSIVVGTDDEVLRETWADLCSELGRAARCITAGDVAQGCGAVDAAAVQPHHAARWLEELASRSGRVFVRAGAAERSALLRSVDRVVVVVPAGDGNLGALGVELDELRATGVPLAIDLVLVHRSHDLPSGTAAWLDAVRPTRHAHLRAGEPRHTARVARLLTDRATVVVLGGSGARAFAHIGVLQALDEMDVAVDAIVASGLGAVLGAQFALDWTPSEMLERNATAWRRAGRELTLPFVSLLGSRTLRALTREQFGDTDIADTWLNLHVCATDLSWAESVDLARGSLARWTRASAAMPGIHPPIVHDGRLYADGGLLEPLPTSTAQELGSTVIAVDASPFRPQAVDPRLEEAPEGLAWLLQSLPVVGTGFPSIVSLIERAVRVSQAGKQLVRRAQCDVLIEPPVDRFRSTDYSMVRPIAALGHLEGGRVLEKARLPAVHG